MNSLLPLVSQSRAHLVVEQKPRSKRKKIESSASLEHMLKKMNTPLNWQSNPAFWLKRSVFIKDVPQALRVSQEEGRRPVKESELLALEEIDKALDEKTLPNFLEIRVCRTINDLGVFALRELEAGTLIGLYASEIKETEKGSRYKYSYRDSLVLDARDAGNYTRFLNSVHPDTEDYNVMPVLLKIEGLLEMALIAKTTIKVGQQCLLNYGKGYFQSFAIDPVRLTPDSQ